jgi:beta-glucosidase
MKPMDRTSHLISAALCALCALGPGTPDACAAAEPVRAAAPTQTVHPPLWPETVFRVPRTPEADLMVERLISQMSLEDKVQQMVQADIAFITPADLQRYKLGSILAGGNAAPDSDLRSSPQAWLDLTRAFHAAALADTGGAHLPIPLLFGIDAVHGHGKIIGATIFPHNVGLGAAHDPALIRRIGSATAEEVAATGIDWTFAPTVAVVRDPRWGRSYESYSEDPHLVAQYAPQMVMGLQGAPATPEFMSAGHTLATIKHFLGDGGTRFGRDQGDTQASEAELAHVHAAGYAPAIDAGAMIVMASYNSWRGVKMHASHALLTDILKGRMGFEGFVVGDWNAQEQLPGCTKYRCPAAILAGVDMVMAPDSWRQMVENLLAEVRSGEIPQARIDDAVRRILRVKAAAGLFSQSTSVPQGGAANDAARLGVLGDAAHRAIARQAVRESLVLLKNEHATLPLDPHSKILVAGAAADDIGVQSGGWSIDWQAIHNSNADFPGATSIYAGIAAAVTRAGGTATLSPTADFTAKPDVAIVVFGEGPYAEFQGDRETLEFSPGDATNLEILRRLRAAGIPTVSVFISGRPLWVNRELNASDAFVAAWLPGAEGGGIADVLFKAADGSVPFDFTGRLPFSWPATAMPVTFDGAGKAVGALFANGFGLDYRSRTATQKLSEEPHIPAYFAAPRGSLFFAGHVTAPWSLFVADGDAEVHVTLPRQSSPAGAVSVTVGATGVPADWNGARVGKLRITGRAVDLQAAAGGRLSLRYRVDRAPKASVSLGVGCDEPVCKGASHDHLLDVTSALRAAPGTWRTLSIPLNCFGAAADLKSVAVPVSIETGGAFQMTLSAVRLVPATAAAAATAASAQCPPRIVGARSPAP